MKKILVTGGAGYIGSVLVGHLLANGHTVTVVDSLVHQQRSLLHFCTHPEFEFVFGDVRDEALMRKLVAAHDAIVALAAIVSPKASARDPHLTESVNYDSIVLLNRLRSPQQPVLFPNTNIGYGAKSGQVYCTEETPLEPNSLYGVTKVRAERELLGSPNAIALRLASIFGPSPMMKTHLLLNYYVHQAVNDGSVIIYERDFKRNFLHVDDIARCFCFCLEHFDAMKNEVYNVGLNDANLTKSELAEKIREQLPSFYIHYAEIGRDPDKRNYVVSNEKINRKGFFARESIETGIRQLIRAYRMIPSSGL